MSDPEIKNPTREEWFWLFTRIAELTEQLEQDCKARGFGPHNLSADQVVRIFALTTNSRSPEMAYHSALQAAVDLAKQSKHSVLEQDGSTVFAPCGLNIMHAEIHKVDLKTNPEQVS